jgi:hypothetical protein
MNQGALCSTFPFFAPLAADRFAPGFRLERIAGWGLHSLESGVSRQTVLQRVKRGELAAVHVMRGKQKGLRISINVTKNRPSASKF